VRSGAAPSFRSGGAPARPSAAPSAPHFAARGAPSFHSGSAPAFRPGSVPNWPSRRASAAPFYAPSAPAHARPYHLRPYHLRHARWLPPLAALGTIYLGSRYYYPYRYWPAEGPYCEGFTEDGCALRWVEVPAEDSDIVEDGDIVELCVEFCPQG